MNKAILSALALVTIAGPVAAQSSGPVVGDPVTVAKRVMKASGHESCDRFSTAVRLHDSSIMAVCANGERFRVFQLGGHEVAMSCTAAKALGVDGC
jgi:hypothetical protein